MKKYNLGFISDDDLYKHVKETMEKYRFNIDKSFLSFSQYEGFSHFDV